ncbi:hypothetical protein BDV36DRAFT_291497 [Aspergillus pseudocaelatus]|uniref:Uncharacterized protein n=1 Tax=Aspergillus pseudocaelatus TaxID=1825620 RepID=A0ABQ6WZ38_9EURO|nr:hypothetical protein BDV36DRAFT_291497 [Aspergillus pseudocaelatus]
MVESPRITTVKHVALATADKGLHALSCRTQEWRKVCRVGINSNSSGFGCQSLSAFVIAGKTPIHPLRTVQSVASAFLPVYRCEQGLLPFVAEEAYGDADLAVMLEDPRVPLGKALNRKTPRMRRDVLSDDAPVVGQYGFVGSGGKASAKFFLESTPGAILRLGPVDMHVMYRTASGNPLATQPANRRTARNLLPRDSRRDKDDLDSRWLMPLLSQHFSKAHLMFIRKLA